MNKNLVEENGNHVLRAIQKHSREGEGVDYGVSLTVVPGDQQNTFVPVLVVALMMNSPVLGEKLMSNVLSFDLYMTEEQMEQMISSQLEAMRAQRSMTLGDPILGPSLTV